MLIRKLSQSAIQNESAHKLEANIENEEVIKVMDALPLGKQAGPNRIHGAGVPLVKSRFCG